MTPQARRLYAVIGELRSAFHRLGKAADELHAGRAITAAMRAVMEALTGGERSVPDIARTRSVSRQHIQVIMDSLLTAGLVRAIDNPHHKRSPLFVLSKKGEAAFGEMRKLETVVLERWAAQLPGRELAAAEEVLRALNALLAGEAKKHPDVEG